MEKHKVLAVYMLSYKPIPKTIVNMAAAALSLLMIQYDLSDWNGRIDYADIPDSKKFKTLDDAILPYIISIDGGKHLAGQPNNTAIILEGQNNHARTTPLYLHSLPKDQVGSFPSTLNHFSSSFYGINKNIDKDVVDVLKESHNLEGQGKYLEGAGAMRFSI